MTTSLRRAAVCVVGAVMLWPAAAQAATVSAPAHHDPRTTFTVEGAGVTVASTNPKLLARVSGRDVIVLCEAGIAGVLAPGDDSDAGPALPIDLSLLANQATWTAGASSVTVPLPCDISDRVDICYLSAGGMEDDPDVAAAFTAAGRDSLASDDADAADAAAAATAVDQLALAYRAAKPASGRFGSARAVATRIHARRPRLQVRVAKRLGGVRRRGVVYVIASRTGGDRLMLAERDTRGNLHVLRVRKGVIDLA